MIKRVLPLLIALSLAACASPSGRATTQAGVGERKEGQGISRAELQDSLLRFEMSFNESLRDAFAPIQASARPHLRVQALRNWILYASSSLAIALGPVPESNLLDMMVFLRLSRSVVERHWIPKVFGEQAEPVLDAFDRGSSDLEQIALKVLNPEQVRRFEAAIDNWRATHPSQVAVEGIRLSKIAEETSAAAAEVESQASGLLANIKKATISADQITMLGERVLYYAERLPFLGRAQLRLALQEISGDSAGIAGSVKIFLDEGIDTFAQVDRTFKLLHRDLALAKELTGKFDGLSDRILLKLTIAALIVVFFCGLVLFAVRATLLRMEINSRTDHVRPRDQSGRPPRAA